MSLFSCSLSVKYAQIGRSKLICREVVFYALREHQLLVNYLMVTSGTGIFATDRSC